MKLYSNGMSPYGRKVMVVIHELGLADRIELVDAQPRLRPDEVFPVNPMGKIPALAVGSGVVVRDSPVIVDYLCATFDGERLLPREGAARWRAMTEIADADGLIEAAILVRNERLRPAERQSNEFIAWNLAKVNRVMDHFERSAGSMDGRWDLGTIAIGCALGYVPRRIPEFEGMPSHPALVEFYKDLSGRTSFARTEPS